MAFLWTLYGTVLTYFQSLFKNIHKTRNKVMQEKQFFIKYPFYNKCKNLDLNLRIIISFQGKRQEEILGKLPSSVWKRHFKFRQYKLDIPETLWNFNPFFQPHSCLLVIMEMTPNKSLYRLSERIWFPLQYTKAFVTLNISYHKTVLSSTTYFPHINIFKYSLIKILLRYIFILTTKITL